MARNTEALPVEVLHYLIDFLDGVVETYDSSRTSRLKLIISVQKASLAFYQKLFCP